MNSEALSVLVDFGLTKTESLVYLTLLKHNSLTAYRVSKESQLYKANTYDALDTLLQKQIVTKSVVNGKTFFVAVPPEQLITQLELKKEKLQNILPTIERSFEEESEDIQVFQGVASFMNILYDLLKYDRSIYVFDIPKTVPEIVRFHIDKFHISRLKKKIKMYHIYDYDAGKRISYLNKMRYTYAKQGLEHRHSIVSTLVCGDVTLIINWSKNLKVVRILDKDVSVAYERQFKLLWDELSTESPRKKGKLYK